MRFSFDAGVGNQKSRSLEATGINLKLSTYNWTIH
jgi:hypothetical protein